MMHHMQKCNTTISKVLGGWWVVKNKRYGLKKHNWIYENLGNHSNLQLISLSEGMKTVCVYNILISCVGP